MGFPHDSTFQLGYAVTPSEAHPDYETHGEAFAVCWILSPSLARAEETARAALSSQGLEILEQEYGDRVTRESYEEGDELLDYFEEAQVEREVFLFHCSPRFPVYRVVVSVRQGQEVAEAHYLVAGESLMGEDDDLYDLEFWTPGRAEQAAAAALRLVEESGWTAGNLLSSEPINYGDVAEDLQEFYDHAEEDGECLVLVRSEVER